MAARRTVAPDIAGCCLLLFAASMSFAVLRAPYVHKHVPEVARDMVVYGGLVLACIAVAMGLFQRRRWALIPGLVLGAFGFGASVANWHMPETGQLPAGVLGATAVVLLLARGSEFSADDTSPPSTGASRPRREDPSDPE
jgi:hypothetical protein